MEWDSFVLAVAEWMMRFNLRIAGEVVRRIVRREGAKHDSLKRNVAGKN